MSVVLTTAGTAHLVELAAGGVLTNAFDALVFGKGNDDPAVTDTLQQVTDRETIVARLSGGFPKLDDDDPRNSGRGASVWTWKFVLESGTRFVASNVALTNYAGGVPTATEPVGVHAKQTVGKNLDERLIVWVNAQSGEDPTVFTATEVSLEGQVQRVTGFAARNRALYSWPNGVTRSDTETRCRPQPGQKAFTFGFILGPEGRSLSPADIEEFTVTRERFKASEGRYVPEEIDVPIECHQHVLGAQVFDDPRVPHGSYNVLHGASLPEGTDEGNYRLKYRMKLCDGDRRAWTNIVEVTP